MTSIKRLDAAARRLSRTARRRAPFHLVFMTDAGSVRDPVNVAKLMPVGSAVLLRDYDMAAPARFALAKKLRDVTADRGVKLLIGADPSLAKALGADGAHLPGWYDGRADVLRMDHPNFLVTRNAHDRRELRRADDEAASAVFVSPVFATRSHPGARPIGPGGLARFARRSNAPVIALGGVSARTVDKLIGTGVAGIAAISAFARF